jgi:hypothetical protein
MIPSPQKIISEAGLSHRIFFTEVHLVFGHPHFSEQSTNIFSHFLPNTRLLIAFSLPGFDLV